MVVRQKISSRKAPAKVAKPDPTNELKLAAQRSYVNQRARNSTRNRKIQISLPSFNLPEVTDG